MVSLGIVFFFPHLLNYSGPYNLISGALGFCEPTIIHMFKHDGINVREENKLAALDPHSSEQTGESMVVVITTDR